MMAHALPLYFRSTGSRPCPGGKKQAQPASTRRERERTGAPSPLNLDKEIIMLNWAIVFLVIAIIAAIFGFSGIAGAAVNIAWILAVIGIILAIAFFVMGRRPPLP